MSKEKRRLIEEIVYLIFLMFTLVSGIVYGLLAKEYMVAGLSILVFCGACVLIASSAPWEEWTKEWKKEKEEEEKEKKLTSTN